jgi:lysophospholipase L1-like esterase
MVNIQVRLDKLRYSWGWNAAARDAIIAQAAADGFNTISIPIQWYEVEPVKDKFDWSILDEYLGLANKYHLKMELLWFGQNSGGHVQWLGRSAIYPSHLRTPDYVLYSPAPDSHATTSDYAIRRDISDYTLDLADNRLKARETYVLSRVMAHVALWDAANGSKHTVIGVQLDNEVRSIHGPSFPASLVVSYMSDLGSAVKRSDYVVWTRLNCVSFETNSRIDANESLRSTFGTNIDFVGTDLYEVQASNVKTALPYKGGNYRMIMESGAEVTHAAAFQLAALAGDNAYDHYDMCGPDGHGLYDRSGPTGFIPHGNYIEDVRTVNKLLNSDITDIATKAQGVGLFVHNWEGTSPLSTMGVEGISFTPDSSTSQAISISRNHGTEIVLMNTAGGTFAYPSSLGITSASEGHFDMNNHWIDERSIPFTSTAISPPTGVTVRLARSADNAAITNQSFPVSNESLTRVKVVLVGDSTVAPQGGWGPGFCSHLIHADCIDLAMNGRSTKSFMDEGLWGRALAEHAQFYFIQFGHNDQKDQPELHTDPEGSFKAHLDQYVRDVRKLGATPILVTPLTRRNYENGHLIEDPLSKYAVATREVAAEDQVPLIDLYHLSRALLEPMSQSAADQYNAAAHEDAKAEGATASKPDRTHLNAVGQRAFGEMVAKAASVSVEVLKPFIIPVVSPENTER